ncbi:thioether cross-link-forming SCIFF peptide maturase [Clostridia bacterium]|nr:thioether cross-link-forming SCIFF peptide maturase [Clostridia bacterium]
MIHIYQFHDLNVVLDVGSGAVHVVSDAAAALLRAREDRSSPAGEPFAAEQLNGSVLGATPASSRTNADEFVDGQSLATFSETDLASARGEIAALTAAGLLDAPEMEEDVLSPEDRGAVIKALCLHAAHDCNMRCAYCFADAGGYAGARALLPLETGKRAIDFLLANSGARRNLEIDFFGGEPLMNFEVIKELVHYGRAREKDYKKNIRFTLTTNGLLLDDAKTPFLNEHMDNVILSIDGRPEVNDRMRRTVSGEGTYAHIADKLLRFAEARDAAGKLYYVRGTYTKYNKNFTEDVRYLADLGFHNISVEPAVSDKLEPWALTEEDLPEVFAEYDRLAAFMWEWEQAGKQISFFHFNVDLEQGPCAYKRVAGCGAGTEYVAVTPEGDIYPCHQFAGETDYRIGNVEGCFQNRWFDVFNKAHVFSKDECRSCWAKYYCGGGCHANALRMEGDLLRPHRLSCAIERKRLECAIGLVCARAMTEEISRE